MPDKEEGKYVNCRLTRDTWSGLQRAQRSLWTIMLCDCEHDGRPACQCPSLSDTVKWLLAKAEAELGRLEVQGVRRKIKAQENRES